jgi:hypothetical protein
VNDAVVVDPGGGRALDDDREPVAAHVHVRQEADRELAERRMTEGPQDARVAGP